MKQTWLLATLLGVASLGLARADSAAPPPLPPGAPQTLPPVAPTGRPLPLPTAPSFPSTSAIPSPAAPAGSPQPSAVVGEVLKTPPTLKAPAPRPGPVVAPAPATNPDPSDPALAAMAAACGGSPGVPSGPLPFPACCPPPRPQYVCVRDQVVQKKMVSSYSTKEVPYCTAHHYLHYCLHRCNGECARVRCVRKLMKAQVPQERIVCKCVPKEVAPCGGRPGGACLGAAPPSSAGLAAPTSAPCPPPSACPAPALPSALPGPAGRPSSLPILGLIDPPGGAPVGLPPGRALPPIGSVLPPSSHLPLGR